MKPLHVLPVCLLLWAVAAPAATVTTLNDGGPGSLRQALSDAAPGDTIDFAVTGTIKLTGGVLAITKDIVIQGPGPSVLSISGREGRDRVMSVSGATAEVSGVTIFAGFSRTAGGGTLIDAGATLILRNCIFDGNLAAGERLQYVFDIRGGAVFNAGTLKVTDCTFLHNEARGTEPEKFAADINGLGGAIFNDATGSLTITNSAFTRNFAVGSPSGNLEGGDGAGGAIYNAGTASITNSTFSQNRAEGGDSPFISPGAGQGGAVFNTGNLSVINCTVSDNHDMPGYSYTPFGVAHGGGVMSAAGTTTLKQVILAGNTRLDPADLHVVADDDCFGSLTSAGHNLIGVDTDCTGFIDGVNGDQVGASGTPTPGAPPGGPLDPQLGPLGDNGGPTQTKALLPGSPAIDAGGATDYPATDQRGAPRPADGNGDGLAFCDIGAYEVQPPSTPTPTLTPTPTAMPVPAEAIQNLIDAVNALPFPAGTANALTSTLAAAVRKVESGNTVAACNQLNAFLNQVAAQQRAGRLGAVEAASLTAAANAIELQVGCQA